MPLFARDGSMSAAHGLYNLHCSELPHNTFCSSVSMHGSVARHVSIYSTLLHFVVCPLFLPYSCEYWSTGCYETPDHRPRNFPHWPAAQEFHALWELLLEALTSGNKPQIAHAALTYVYYWYNFMPLARGTAVTGYITLLAIFLAADMPITSYIPKVACPNSLRKQIWPHTCIASAGIE